MLKSNFSGYFTTWFRTEKILYLERGNLKNSTKTAVPTHQSDWLLPFRIQYETDPPPTTRFFIFKQPPSVGRTEEWITRLCDEFFNGQGESCLFKRRPGSKLLHPISSTVSHQPLGNYRLAGQILGKAIVETLLRGICTQLSQIRFTRSLLAFILGFPITLKVCTTLHDFVHITIGPWRCVLKNSI